MEDGPRPLDYKGVEVGPPAARVASVAVGVGAAFVAAALVMMVPGLPDRVRAATVWPWAAMGAGTAGMAALVRARVRRRRPYDARAAYLMTVLLLVGLILGLLGVMAMPLQMRIRDTSPRVKCASNLKQIGSAILLYSNDHQGSYPDRMERLLLEEDISAEVFVCPVAGDDYARGPTTRAVADGLTSGGHLSYVYVGAGLRNGSDPDTVVLYEPLANHHGAGMNVLFADGHVEFVRAAEAREIVDRVASGERPVIWKGPGVRAGPTTRGG